MSKKAFTLVELMIVIAIIGILAAALFPSLTGYLARSKDTARLAQVKNIMAGNELFRSDIGRYANPATDTGCSGWDTPQDGIFIPELNNYMKFKNPDGTSSPWGIGSTTCGWLQYYRYAAGNGGCPMEKGAFYVILIQRVYASSILDNPGFTCTLTDWTQWYHAPDKPVPIVSGAFEG